MCGMDAKNTDTKTVPILLAWYKYLMPAGVKAHIKAVSLRYCKIIIVDQPLVLKSSQ